MAFSYWESNEWLEGIDLLVVGAGIVGLSAALRARETHPDWRIVVVESDPFGGGGSSRNAGFSCFGSATELAHDRKALGDDAALELVQNRWQGLKQLRSEFGDAALGHAVCGSIELFPSTGRERRPSSAELADLNRWIEPVTGVPDTFTEIGLEALSHLAGSGGGQPILSRLEGLLDTGKMNRAFREKAQASGIDLLFGMRVERIEPGPTGAEVAVVAGQRRKALVKTKRAIIATNALGRELMPGLDVQPAVNHVLVTNRMPGFGFPHAVHMDAGYVYARPIEDRMLIGGGRHWGLDESATVSELEGLLHKLWPQTRDAGIAYRWSGQLGVGTHRSPIVKTIAPGVVAAVRMGGMGVAIGMEVGRLAAKKITTN